MTENGMNHSQAELLESTKKLNDAIRNILESGTLEQKVELLAGDYQQRMANEEFQRQNKIQTSLLYKNLGIYDAIQVPTRPKF